MKTKRKKRPNAKSKLGRIIKWVSVFCIAIIFVEVCYMVVVHFKRESKISHFDGLNQVVSVEDGYIGAGSSDFYGRLGYKNEERYEKARLAFYDENFNLTWEKVYQKGYNTTFYSVAKVKDGYVAVGSGEFTEDQNQDSLRDALIVKYDLLGNEVWAKQVQVISNAKFMKVKALDDGFLVAGQSLFAPMDLGVSEGGGALLIKYDLDGNEVWRDNYGGSKSAIYNDFVILEDAYYAVGKDAYNTGILVKYDVDGTREWVKNYSYTDKLGFSSILEKEGELYIVGGQMKDSETDNLDSLGLFVKYDLDGKMLLERTYQGTLIERYNRMAFDHDGNLIVIGYTGVKDQTESTATLNVFHYNGLLVKYDQNGQEVYVKEIGGTGDDYFNDILILDDKYVVLSYTNSKDRDLKGIGNGKDFHEHFISFDTQGKINQIR